ncbi:ribosome biogenesis GTPase YqeH [Bacillus salitolerans]|uniref:Ribosome biogenesis GTPase YqeH n=1 Tax=Bacillus salitolerans TaxID=1437434 RepID=A0ABW4LQ82_9BACI
MSEQFKCIGCGIGIQTDEQEGLGYAPPSSLMKEVVICQRCFRLKHYNEVQDVSLTDDDFLKILNGLGKRNALIVKIVDIFDFTGSWLPGLHRFVGNNEIILVGNKADLLPKSVKSHRVINWMKHEAKEFGLKPLDIFLISAEKGYGMKELVASIEDYRNGKDVYVVGCTNVGKSTFINRILKEFGGEQELITTSHFPGTTLDVIDIPIDDHSTLVDTPGIINHHQMAHYVQKSDFKYIMPKKEIKPKVFQLNQEQTLFFGGMARLDFVSGNRQSFVCYVSNEINIHRTKLENAEELYTNHLGDMLSPPRKEDLASFPELQSHVFTVREEKVDIVFSGLGWVTINEPGTRIVAHAPKGVGVSIRRSLI